MASFICQKQHLVRSLRALLPVPQHMIPNRPKRINSLTEHLKSILIRSCLDISRTLSSNTVYEMPVWDELVQWISTNIYNPTVGILNRVWQQRVGRMSCKNSWAWKAIKINRILVIFEKMKLTARHKRTRAGSVQGGLCRSIVVSVYNGEIEGLQPCGAWFWESAQ